MATPMPDRLTSGGRNPTNNIILMTDGYKFSHHKQFPVSWLPEKARPKTGDMPPIIFEGVEILKLLPVPRLPGDDKSPYKVTIVTSVSTAVQEIKILDASATAQIVYTGTQIGSRDKNFDAAACIASGKCVLEIDDAQRKNLKLPEGCTKFEIPNVDESKLKRGSNLNTYEGGSNVSYFTPRAYSHVFSHLTGDQIVFFGLQYFMKEYLSGEVITKDIIDEADAFIARYMSDVRVAGPGVDFTGGYDYTMFPRGDWEAMLTGDYDNTGTANEKLKGRLPIRIEALPEGTTASPGVCLFKLTNTHPRFFWLPNFLETLLVQVWYPTSVATQAREFKKTIQAYSILSARVSQMAPVFGMPGEFTAKSVPEDNLAIHIAQVFDLLDFGYRGVSSHETAGLGSAAYYTAGLEGSDTVAGSRLLLKHYNGGANFSNIFEAAHGATSVPAAEHSTITSWADVSPDAEYQEYEAAEYNAFRNMFKQYMPSFAISLVSDGFNIWNAVARQWPCEKVPPDGGDSMRTMLKQRLEAFQLNLIRPDSGEGVETLPQLLTILNMSLPEHWQAELPPLASDVFSAGDPYNDKYKLLVESIRKYTGCAAEGNPFRRFTGQQMRVLQGDGVALDTVGDMLASLLANGFCANCVHFGSGGGLLQKLNRDSLAFAFKCCAMYVGSKEYAVGKDPIAGGKKSYGGNPCVIRGEDGLLRNRGEYDDQGNLTKGQPMSYEEFCKGAAGDCLVKVFENGEILVEQQFADIMGRAKITKLYPEMRKAVDNLEKKMEFLQKMSSDEAIAIRLAEASCGSKWNQAHKNCLDEVSTKFPKYAETFKKIGITPEMSAKEVVDHIKNNHMCEKKVMKKVFRALDDDEPDAAIAAMGSKYVLTL